MVSDEVLQKYSTSIRRLKQQCLDAGMNEEEFKKIYFDSLKSLKNETNRTEPGTFQRLTVKHIVILIGVIGIICGLCNIKPIYSNLVCNLQELIYPGLRFLRLISIPFISLFPSLTELYHETCLIQNPFFTVVDMDCWPCSTVHNVREVYDPKPGSQLHNAPFIYETEQEVIKLKNLKEFYLKNKLVIDQEASKILVNNKPLTSPHDLFHNDLIDEKKYFVWRFNNMNAARLLRQVIPRPKIVPKFGQGTERFIIIDTSLEKFQIPDTECSFSFLLALSGSRTIILVPAEECKHQCKYLKVDLKESHLLWYNWWYWRPVVQPSMGNTTFIAHLGSYC